MPISARIEDYLEALLTLEMEGDAATVTNLSRQLNVRKATVVSAVRKLMEGGFLHHEPYGDLVFSEEGRERALTIFRRHHLLAFLFEEVMGFKPERALEVACATEHFLDQRSEKKLSTFVDFYSLCLRDQEGWTRRLGASLEYPDELPLPLLMLPPDGEARIVRLTARDQAHERLKELEVLPGKAIRLLKQSEDRKTIGIELGGKTLNLSRSEAMTVWVSREGNC